jgi:hypothetical protein
LRSPNAKLHLTAAICISSMLIGLSVHQIGTDTCLDR